MKEKMKELGYWLEDKLKDLCGEITPDKRLTVILIVLLLVTIANLYFTFKVVYDWGKESERKEQLKMEHIKSLELKKNRIDDFIDSEPRIESLDSILYNCLSPISKLVYDLIISHRRCCYGLLHQSIK